MTTDIFTQLLRTSKQSAEEAARAEGEITGLRQVIGAQEQNIGFLQGTVIEGQQTQQDLTSAIQTNVLRSLSNFQLQQKVLIQEFTDAQKKNKALLFGALAVGAIAILT